MDSYHGTSSVAAALLVSAKVDVSVGGGELGRGFYTGQHLHEAKAWAFHKSGDRGSNVVCFSTPNADIERLDIDVLDPGTAALTRHRLRKNDQTRTYLFEVDMVWAPIVGSERATGDQYKWESSSAQDLLNGVDTTKKLR